MSLESDQKPNASWPGALAGSALFALGGVILVLSKLPYEAGWQWTSSLYQAFFLLLIVLPSAFFAAGWVKGFPAWSYPYIAHVLQWSSLMTQAATPGLRERRVSSSCS